MGEVVTVKTESPILQTASADLGPVAARDFLDNVTLMSTVLNLANMAPGVLASGSQSFGGTIGNSQ